jgi:hypothetical protein
MTILAAALPRQRRKARAGKANVTLDRIVSPVSAIIT